jgi:hypothetical protein
VKSYIDCREMWSDKDFEMLAVEVKSRNTKFVWEIVGIYRAPNEGMRALERLVVRTGFTGNSTKRSIVAGDINLPWANWKGNVGCSSEAQTLINNLVWDSGYTQVVENPTRQGDLLDIYLVRPETSVLLAVQCKG